jgi:hypothetical protein
MLFPPSTRGPDARSAVLESQALFQNVSVMPASICRVEFRIPISAIVPFWVFNHRNSYMWFQFVDAMLYGAKLLNACLMLL